MTILGTFNILAEPGAVPPLLGDTINFNNCQFPNGFPDLDQINIGEPVNSMGVDNTRLRIVRKDYPRWTMIGISSVADWAAAVTLARTMRQLPTRRTGVYFTLGGQIYDFSLNTFYVHSVSATPRNGEVSQAGATLVNGYVESRFELQRVS